MKKSFLLFGAAIGIVLVAVGCGANRGEVSYEIPSTAATSGSGGGGVKAKPAAPRAFSDRTTTLIDSQAGQVMMRKRSNNS